MDTDPRVSRRQFIRRAAVMTGAVALVAACGPSQPPAAKPTEASASKPAAPAAPAAAPAAPAASPQTAPATKTAEVKTGGTINVAQEIDPVSLDPHKTSNFSAVQAFEHVYESLTQYDDKLNVQPALAERWESSPDGLTWTFYLRQGVKWHDGSDFTSADVKYWHERLMAPETSAPYKNWFDLIEKVEPVDKSTVKMHLKAPFPHILATFAAMRGGAIIKEGAAETSNLATTAIGTGPFKLVEYVQQDRLRFQKNKDYWNKELPYVDEVVMKIMTEEDARVAALRAGQMDMAVLSADGAAKLKGDRNVTVLQSPKAWLTVIMFNAGQPPFNDARVRHALALALDYNEIIQKAVSGAGVLSGPVPTGHTDWFIPPEKLPFQKPQIDEAKRLLAEAGFPKGLKLTLKTSPQYPEFVSMALVAQEAWKKIGVEAEVVQLEWGTLVKAVNAPNFDYQAYTTARTFYPDPDQYLYPYFHPKGATNPGPYNNAKVTELLDRARSTMDREKRRQDYLAAQDILLQENPHIWAYNGLNIEAIRNNVKGYLQSFTGRRIFLKQTWIER